MKYEKSDMEIINFDYHDNFVLANLSGNEKGDDSGIDFGELK